MANRTEWELAADASKLLKELDSVTGALKGLKKGTDTAEKGLADFQAAEEAVAQAAEEAEESFNNLMEGVESFGEAAGEVDSILAGMAGSLEMFDELAGTDFSEVAATAVEFAAGIESVSRAISMASPQMAAIAVVALALAVAYKHVTEKAEAAAAAKKAAKERSKELREEYAKLENAVWSIGLEWSVFTKALTETEAEEKRVAKALTQSAAPALKVYETAVKDTSDAVNKAAVLQWKLILARDRAVESAEKEGQSEYNISLIRGYHNDKIQEQTEVVNILTAAQAEAVEGQKKAEATLDDAISKKQIMIRVSAEQAAIDKDTADTVDTVADAITTVADAYDTAADAVEAYADAVESLTDQALADSMSATDKVNKKYEDLADALEALEAASMVRQASLRAEIAAATKAGDQTERIVELNKLLQKEVDETAKASAGIVTAWIEQGKALKEVNDQAEAAAAVKFVKEYDDSLKDISESGDTWIGKLQQTNALIETLNDNQLEGVDVDYLRAESMEFNAATAMAGMKAMGDGVEVFGDMFGTAIDLVMARNDDLTDQQREMLWVMYEMQKAAAITSITIDTAAAIVSALEWAGPFGPAVGAAIAATGVMQAGIVMATPPPFHVGGIVPDGSGLVAALPGEAFLNRQATANLGADGVAALNSGGGGGGMVIQNVYGHRVFDRFVIDNINKGGPLNSAIKGNTRVGHRKRSTV